MHIAANLIFVYIKGSIFVLLEIHSISYLSPRLALLVVIGSNPFLKAIRDRLINDRVLQ